MKSQRDNRQRGAFTLMEMLVVVAIIATLATIGYAVTRSVRASATRAEVLSDLRNVGAAFHTYVADNNDTLPLEDAPGSDDWVTAASPEAKKAWYNVLPEAMGAQPVGDLGDTPELFYQENYPLYVKGAPYPRGDDKLKKPHFAFAMNSRLQRKNAEGIKVAGRLVEIEAPVRTVAFLERGMPGEKKTSSGQGGFDSGPKANPRAFVGRHNQKGILLFIDGHAESHPVSAVILKSGKIPFPQGDIIWTADPDEDPN